MEGHPLGIPEIDSEHSKLHSTVAELQLAVAEMRPAAEICRLLEKLATEAGQHFASEEQHMRQHGYPKADEHAREHTHLLDALESMRRSCQEEAIPLDLPLIRVLWDWLDGHITSSDYRYARFVLASEL